MHERELTSALSSAGAERTAAGLFVMQDEIVMRAWTCNSCKSIKPAHVKLEAKLVVLKILL